MSPYDFRNNPRMKITERFQVGGAYYMAAKQKPYPSKHFLEGCLGYTPALPGRWVIGGYIVPDEPGGWYRRKLDVLTAEMYQLQFLTAGSAAEGVVIRMLMKEKD